MGTPNYGVASRHRMHRCVTWARRRDAKTDTVGAQNEGAYPAPSFCFDA